MNEQDAIASPCVNICQMHAATGWCEGCQRTLDEIAAWGRMDDFQKTAVCAQLESRRATWLTLYGPLSLSGRASQALP